MPSADAWHWRVVRSASESQATGRSGAVRPDKVPSVSYMEGTLFYSARHRRFSHDKHARKGENADRGNELQETAANYPLPSVDTPSRYPHRSNKRRRHAS